MKKITMSIASNFKNGRSLKISNTETDGQKIWLYGNKIAERIDGELWITLAGWNSNTTKERLNGLDGVSIKQKNFILYLNDKEWNGELIRVKDNYQKDANTIKEYNKHQQGSSLLKTTAIIAELGNLFCKDDLKANNDWKARMLKIGLGNWGLIMPEDWETLRELDKQTRLNGAIKMLL